MPLRSNTPFQEKEQKLKKKHLFEIILLRISVEMPYICIFNLMEESERKEANFVNVIIWRINYDIFRSGRL